MASHLSRLQLARAARALNAGAGHGHLPALILATDETRGDAIAAARDLPRGAAILVRHSDATMRAALAARLGRFARARGFVLLVAGDAELALRVKAQGLHLPEARAREAAHWKMRHPEWLVTVAAHSEAALLRAALFHADAALLAPAFPTASHRTRDALGVPRFRLMASRAGLPVYALGGVNAISVRRLNGAALAGIVAIEGLTADSRG